MPSTPETPVAEAAPPAPVSLLEAFRYWLRLGFISFGGPAGQISLMHTELVERRRWISEHRFLHALNYTMVLPGPEAQQLATYIGWLMHGTLGGIMAGVLFVLPSLGILIALTWIYLVFGDVPVVAGVLYGIKPAVTAIVVFAAYRISSRALPVVAEFCATDFPSAELICIVSTKGFDVQELPIRIHDREGGESMFTFWKAFYYPFKLLLAISMVLLRNKM